MQNWVRASTVGLTAVLLLTTGATAAGATGPERPATADAISKLIDSVSDQDETLIEPQSDSSRLVATATDGTVEVHLPFESGDISLEEQANDTSIAIGLPLEAPVDTAEVAEAGTVVYKSSAPQDGADVGVQVIEDGSVRIQTVISTAEAPHEFTYPLTLPEGTRLSFTEDGGVIGVNDEDNFIAGVQAPWARDAQGNDVSTSFRIDGNSIIQEVSPVAADRYPRVADPYFGKRLISKSVWARNLWKYSPTLKVYPTAFGRNGWWGAPPAARWAAWKEALAKTARKGWPNPNTSSMRDQFYCHFDIVRFRAPNKEYWGLDSKLPNRGYAGFVRNSCN